MGFTAKKFLLSFLILVSVLSAIAISLNLYINPFGYYGDKSMGYLKVFNAQIAKYNYLNRLKDKPDAYVLGSSNSMRMRPHTIDSLFNVRSFNYGVYQASVEDFYCIANALITGQKAKPKLMIFCLDDWNFKNFTYPRDEVFLGAQNRLAYKRPLAKYLKDFNELTLFWCRLKSGLSSEQLEYCAENIKTALKTKDFQRRELEMTGAFYKDGTRQIYADDEGKDITELAESGEYKLSAYLKSKHEAALKINRMGKFPDSHEAFRAFEPKRLALFEELIELLDQHHVQVIINVMPVQPYHQEIVRQFSDYDQRISELLVFCNRLKAKHANILIVKDNHEVRNFNGFAEHFFDNIHPTSVNSDSMLVSIKRQLN